MLFEKYQNIIEKAVAANRNRTFYAQYPEHPKAYGEEAPAKATAAFKTLLHQPFKALLQEGESGWAGEEISPYTLEPSGITYPLFPVDTLISRAAQGAAAWAKAGVASRAAVLVDSLEKLKGKFFEIAYATMHTTGQSFIMSFQASGPHAADRALEAIAMGYEELNRFPSAAHWEKPMGKNSLKIEKFFKAIPRGTGVVIGCSTFPVWNTLPGVYASLVTGNPVIIKPHPLAVLPIAIMVSEIQKALKENGFDPCLCQLAADSTAHLIAKELCEHPMVKLIDYTGGTAFGDYIESLKGKSVFTEKAGVNSVILDSVNEVDAVVQNLAFAVSLYSGQMCTAPQNFFIPEQGIRTATGQLGFNEVTGKIREAIRELVHNPKMGAGTLGALQNEATLKRAKESKSIGAKVLLAGEAVENEEFPGARTFSPTVLEVSSADAAIYEKELFGPVILVIKTKNSDHSLQLAREMALKHGAITCAAYTTDPALMERIAEEMNEAFTPVSFNFTGFIWVNQHAAFSDFHVTGGNPAGNAGFTTPEFITKRFVWVGNRVLDA